MSHKFICADLEFRRDSLEFRRDKAMVAVGVIIFPAPRDAPCFPVLCAPFILIFFLELSSVSPGGLCLSHCVLDEITDGVP